MGTPIAELLGGRPSLDFVNTVDPRIPAGRDRLTAPAALIAWARRAFVVGSDWEASASHVSVRSAQASLRRAVALRELLYGVLSAAAEGQPPTRGLRRELARVVDEVRRQERLDWSDGSWTWQVGTRDPFRLLEQLLVHDALDLLLGGARVRRCQSPECGWLFLDTTKNHSRRWCSMATCGNTAKARRRRERRRDGAAG
jgi:predicted RNA-binding Zn ribbon-like protein